MNLRAAVGRDRLGAVRPARVIQTYLDDANVPVADVVDGNGRVYFAARLLVSAGGREDAWQTDYPTQRGDRSAPDKQEPDVLIAVSDGAVPTAYVIGVLAAQQRASWTTASRDRGDNTDTDPSAVSLDDLVWHRKGGELALINGMPVMRSQRSVHVELVGDDGVLRISRAGQASERLLLAGPALDYLDDLQTRVSELTAQVQSLTTYCQTLAAALGVAATEVPPTGPSTPVTAGTLSPAAATPPPAPLVTTTNINNPSTPAGRDAMMARAIRVSSDPES